jgi:hypothetical protein
MGLVACAAAQAKVKPRSLSDSQAAILERGFKVKVANTQDAERRVRVKIKGSSFDEPDWAKLVRTKRLRLAPHSRKRLKLKLNARGREAIESCAGRELRVRVGGHAKRRDLIRDTAACAPRPVDLSRAGECDFIGQQEGSLCLLPFPDDYNTVADPSTRTGRRVALKTAAMPANVGGTRVDAAPYDLNDGFSPGQSIVLKVPGPIRRRRSRPPTRCRSTISAATPSPTPRSW